MVWTRPTPERRKEEHIAPEIEGRNRHCADHRHIGGAEAQKVCGLFLGLRERDREFISAAQAMTPRALVIELRGTRRPPAVEMGEN